MKSKYLLAGALGITLALSLNVPLKQARANNDEVEFVCAESFDTESGKALPTTFAWKPEGKIAIIRWESEAFLNSGFSPQQRCDSVSPRFQEAYDNDSFGMITNSTMNNQSVICTTDEYGGDCKTLLMTLRPKDDSLRVLGNLRKIFNGEQAGAIKHNGGITQAYYRVDIERFLETAPVE